MFFDAVLYSETLNKQRRGATETRLEILSQLHGENKPNQVINERDASSVTTSFQNKLSILPPSTRKRAIQNVRPQSRRTKETTNKTQYILNNTFVYDKNTCTA